jgi:maleamate amidohydrolase
MRAARAVRRRPSLVPEKCLPARGFSVESGDVTAGSAGRERRVTSGKDDEEFFRQRGFGIKMGFGERPALIVIDMIKGFTDSNMPLGANLDTQIAAQTPLVEVAHERGIPVIFSTVVYEEEDVKDAGVWALKQSGSRTLTAGSEAVKVDPRLPIKPKDILLVKKYASCFFGTDLVPRLNARRIDTLIITGCTTSGCVRATAVDAVQNGFRPMVVREAVGDRSVAAHDQSLFDLNAKYADVVSLDETLQYLKTVGHNQPAG